MKLKIKTGDTVKIIAGEEKGKEGKVLRVDREKNRAIVEGLNLVKKHTKPNAQNPQGGIVEKEASIHISNLALIDPKTKKTTRVGFEVRDGKKVRISKKSNVVIYYGLRT